MQEHLCILLQRLQYHKLPAELSKCQSRKSNVQFKGHLVCVDGIAIGSHKGQGVEGWSKPRDGIEVHAFRRPRPLLAVAP